MNKLKPTDKEIKLAKEFWHDEKCEGLFIFGIAWILYDEGYAGEIRDFLDELEASDE